eukprot:10513583-Ditylum_brightwellii.AAC.2
MWIAGMANADPMSVCGRVKRHKTTGNEGRFPVVVVVAELELSFESGISPVFKAGVDVIFIMLLERRPYCFRWTDEGN